MTKSKKYDQLNQVFVNDINNLIGFNEMHFYYLINSYNAILSGHLNCYGAWVYLNQDYWAVGLWIEGNYFLFSNNTEDETIQYINNQIDFTIYLDGFHFAGTKDLIEKIAESHDSFSLNVFKERYFYQIEEIKLNYEQKFLIELARKNDIAILSEMKCNFFEEEYSGKNNKNLEDMKLLVEEQINSETIFTLKSNCEILGFCTIMSFLSSSYNMIGTIFIRKEERNKQLGTELLFFITKMLLLKNEKIFLMTDKSVANANKMVENIGYKKIYNYLDTEISKK